MSKKDEIMQDFKKGMEFLKEHQNDNTIDEHELFNRLNNIPDVDIDIEVAHNKEVIEILEREGKEF